MDHRVDGAGVSIGSYVVSWQDLVLVGGGLSLLVKGTMEIHHAVEGGGDEGHAAVRTFAVAIVQIVLLDIVFSLDSVITAVGMAEHLPVMIAAVLIAVGVMLLAAAPVSRFIERHPKVKMVALSFLLLVGVALIADGLHFIFRAVICTLPLPFQSTWKHSSSSRLRHVSAVATGRVLKPIDRTFPRQRRAVPAFVIQAIGKQSQHRIEAERIVVVDILVAKRHGDDPLADEGPHRTNNEQHLFDCADR